MHFFINIFFYCSLLVIPLIAHAENQRLHGLTIHGDLKYPADFKHFEYVNPDAPKGGEVKLAAIGTFDTLNPFTLRGVAAAGLSSFFETLMTDAEDEASANYGLIAESVELAPDNSSVIFHLRDIARFHDDSPITAEDVLFSFETLMNKGHPRYRSYYAEVEKAVVIDKLQIKFIFKTNKNRELAFILGQLPILSKQYWQDKDFEKTTLTIPLSSGAYKISKIEAGRSITFERIKNYWGEKLPVNLGQNNFDSIRYDYYRDAVVALQAFKAGEYDFRAENSAKDWATGYESPALQAGLFMKEEIAHELPTGMQGFVFNTRRPIFADVRVREALNYAFDFEWANKNLFHQAYTRTHSYFSNSELAAEGKPSPEEALILKELAAKYPEHVPATVFEPFTLPMTDGSGNMRENLKKAVELLKTAGWQIENKKLVNKAQNLTLSFEILLDSPQFERIVLPFKQNLERLGAEVKVRTVDVTQSQKLEDEFNFDMIVNVWGQSLSPGNEQRDFWHSSQVNQTGSRNLAGINNPAIDAAVEAVINAPDRKQLIVLTKVLDRLLLAGHYVVPHWHVRHFRVAYWNKFSHPEKTPRYSLGFNAWWVDKTKESALNAKKGKI